MINWADNRRVSEPYAYGSFFMPHLRDAFFKSSADTDKFHKTKIVYCSYRKENGRERADA